MALSCKMCNFARDYESVGAKRRDGALSVRLAEKTVYIN